MNAYMAPSFQLNNRASKGVLPQLSQKKSKQTRVYLEELCGFDYGGVGYKLIHKKPTLVFKELYQFRLKARETIKNEEGFGSPNSESHEAGLFNSNYLCAVSDYLLPCSGGVFSFMCLKFSYFCLERAFSDF